MSGFGDVNKGTYVAAKFDQKTLEQIKLFQETYGIPNPVLPEDLHCTIVYSRVKIPFMTSKESYKASEGAKTKVFETRDNKRALVLALVDADGLKQRHEYGNILGATYDYPDYIPHVTVSYDIGMMEFPLDMPVDISFTVTKEYVEDLNLDWAKDK